MMQYNDTDATLAKLFSHAVLPRAELDALLSEYRSLADEHGAESAQAIAVRNRIVESNMRLVGHVAKRYIVPRGWSRADLVQLGVPGLIMAVEKFDADRNCAFSTYATWWLRHSIGRALEDGASTVRIPVHAQRAKPGTQAGDNAQAARRMCSLDAQTNTDGDSRPFSDYLEDDGDDALDSALQDEASKRVRAALERLPPKLRQCIEHRFWSDKTLRETGELMGNLSREAMRQQELQALAMLRTQLAESLS